ncbi:PIN domain-containing protein [Hungatella hathewayi]|uniref:PIN domain-containing protein n=1 Tax=Hungatella hathewayi TaxID=154046 RepID=UPI003561F659
MKKKYYVDVENVACGWMPIYKELDEDDWIVLFTSIKTNLPYSVLRELLDINKINQITILEAFVRCCGDSALDYYLMSTLKNDAYYDKDSEYIIVSNDKDFDDFVSDMSNDGYHISRLSLGKTAEPESHSDCFIQHPDSFSETSKALLALLGKKKHAMLLGLIPKETRNEIKSLVQSFN